MFHNKRSVAESKQAVMECEQSSAEHAADFSAVYTSDRLQPAPGAHRHCIQLRFASEHDSGRQVIQWENINKTDV